MSRTRYYTVAILVLALVGIANPAQAAFSDGHWRAELTLGQGVGGSSIDRDDDFMTTLSLEYAFPVASRVELGLRGMAFYYDADTNNDLDDLDEFVESLIDDFDLRSSINEESVYGLGFGIAARFYVKKNEYRGCFIELATHALAHEGNIPGNNSNINFYSTAGIGYQFKSGWHLVGKYGHISNAGLGSSNSGSNVASIGVGFSF